MKREAWDLYSITNSDLPLYNYQIWLYRLIFTLRINMDNNVLKLSGKFDISGEIVVDENYTVAIEWSIVSKNQVSNQDGTYTNIYTLRPIRWEIHDSQWKSIKAKDNRRNSEKYRSFLFYSWSNEETGFESFDEYYDSLYRTLMLNHWSIKTLVKK